jgi:predicted nucleic acid-binding protein
MRHRGLSCRLAIEHMTSAKAVLSGRTLNVETESVLRIAEKSGCSAYDAEYVAVGKAHDMRLVTADRQLLAAFPGIAVSLDEW